MLALYMLTSLLFPVTLPTTRQYKSTSFKRGEEIAKLPLSPAICRHPDHVLPSREFCKKVLTTLGTSRNMPGARKDK